MAMVPPAAEEALHRGLMLKPEHAERFLDASAVGHPGKRKVLELRNHNLRCVQPGGVVYLMACKQAKNVHGVNVLKCLARITFKGNEPMAVHDLQSRFQEHFCTDQEFKAISEKWKTRAGSGNTAAAGPSVVAWRFEMTDILDPPKFVRHKSGQAGQPGAGSSQAVKQCGNDLLSPLGQSVLRLRSYVDSLESTVYSLQCTVT